MAGKAKDTERRFVVTMRLYPEPWQVDILNKRFQIMEHLQNSLIAFELRKLRNLQHTKAWRELETQIGDFPKEKRKPLYKQREQMLRDAGFSEFAFIDDMTPMQKHFQHHIGAHVAHKTATDVWRAFDKVLHGTGERVSFKRRGTLESVGTKKNNMTMKDGCFVWNGGNVKNADGKQRVLSKLEIRMQEPKTEYELQAFAHTPVTYRVLRRWYRSTYNWYVQITFKGDVPMREHPVGTSRVGIDIGTSSIAIASDTDVKLLALAPDVERTHEKKVAVQRKMDRSRRAMNPDNYNPDGTIRRGVKLTRNESERYKRLAGKFRELARREAAQRKYQHILLANSIIALGTEVYVEDNSFAGMQQRAKETLINEETGRYESKKRFGKSLASRAPAELISILDGKLKNVAGHGVSKVDRWEYKASQYDHTAGEYEKKELYERWRTLSNGDTVQRDMYSAWLLMNSGEDLCHPDDERCRQNYEAFKRMHDLEVERIRRSGAKLSSFGIR